MEKLNSISSELLLKALANPVEVLSTNASGIESLVNDFPQSGLLRALLAGNGHDQNIKHAAAYINPATLYKLVNFPETLAVVDARHIAFIDAVDTENAPAPIPNPKNILMGGYQMLVRGEIMRAKYRNSFEKPEAMVPGLVTKVNYALPDVAHTFKKGHRIMIQVQNSWFPLGDRNPQKFMDIYQAEPADFQKATHRIFHDVNNASSITISVLK